jgi:MFS family permease
MQTTSRKTIWIWTIGSFFAFFVFGFSDNLKGATIPAFLRDLNFSYSIGGSILLGVYVGFLIATLFTGILADITGKKNVLLMAGACLVIGIIGFSSFSTFWPLAVSMMILGLGLGAIELGANNIIVDLHTAQKAKYLNLMAVLHGLGSMVAPLYAGFLLAAGFSWRIVYQGALVLVAIMVVYLLLAKYPRVTAPSGEKIGSLGIGVAAPISGGVKWQEKRNKTKHEQSPSNHSIGNTRCSRPEDRDQPTRRLGNHSRKHKNGNSLSEVRTADQQVSWSR